MKRWPFVALLAVAAIGIVWYFNRGSNPAGGPPVSPRPETTVTPSSAPGKTSSAGVGSNVAAAGAVISNAPASTPLPYVPPAPPRPVTPYAFGSADKTPAMEPATVLNNMRIVFVQYASRFGGNPVGTNEEITRALNGENPKEVRFIGEESGLRINGRGELVDYWGTPFFFHQLSGTEMEIHSAGPDRIMFTPDDLVTK